MIRMLNRLTSCTTFHRVWGGPGGWHETYSIVFEDELDNLMQWSALPNIRLYEFDATSEQRLAIVFERAIPDGGSGAELMRNQWVTAFASAPEAPQGRIIAGEPMSDAAFLPLMRGLWRYGGGIKPLMLLRARLERLSLEACVAFQSALVQKVASLRRFVPDLEWGVAAWMLLMDGPQLLQRAAAGDIHPVWVLESVEDVTDVAEWVLGREIDVPGFGTSRSVERDRTERGRRLATMIERYGPTQSFAGWLSPSNPTPQWLSWRAIVEDSTATREIIVFGPRDQAIALATMTARARALLETRGKIVSNVELLDTKSTGPKHGMPAIYHVERRDDVDYSGYARLRGL
ncbi:MAG: hypothetical protein J7480_05470 [Microbacteriaceae bacterium]|nr:hypothetical protein [Microbacteriaceae bacterium]